MLIMVINLLGKRLNLKTFSTAAEIYMQPLECTALSTALHPLKFTMEQESNGELVLLDTLLKRNSGKISVLVYRKPTYTDQDHHYSSHHQTNCKESVVSSMFNRIYSVITNIDDLYKENARIKQVLKENVYHEHY